MLKGKIYNIWRAHKVGSNISHEICADMDNMHLLSYYLDRHVLVINGEFSTNNKPFNTVHCYVYV